MAIYFSSENIKFDLRGKLKVNKWITDLIKAQNKKVGDISYLFCDDAYLIGAIGILGTRRLCAFQGVQRCHQQVHRQLW